MRKRPAFTALAVTTLALGIGVNVASFAVAYGILIRPLPYREPSRVVVLNLLFADGNDLGFSPRALRDWLPRLLTVDAAAGYYSREVTVRSGATSMVVPAALVTDQFFAVLGTPAEFGHAAVVTDTPDVVVGGRAARQILQGEPSAAVNAVLSVSDQSRTISGIMAFDFAFPNDQTSIWLPSQVLKPDSKPEGSGYSRIVARLKPGVTLAQVRDDVNRVRLELNPKSTDTVSVTVLGESAVGGLGQLLMTVLAGSTLVLLVACANVATLFIGRDVARQRELAARMALGASSADLVRSVFVETLLIAGMASVVGMGLGAWTLQGFLVLASGTIPGLHLVEMGLPVAVAIATLTLVVTLLCGIVPAWHAARADFSPFLRATSAPRPRGWRVRYALVVAQIALSCVLLIGAGLLARTVSVLMHEDHGVRPKGVLAAKFVLSDTVLFRGGGREAFVTSLLERLRTMPDVVHAGFGTSLPPRPALVTMAVDFVSDNRKERLLMRVNAATPGYLRALGAQFVAGRDFSAADEGARAAVVILSESAARFYFAADDPLGRTISRLPGVFGMTASPTVIGVVRDVKYEGLDSQPASAMYIPWGLRPFGSGYLLIRTAGDPMRLAPDIRRAAQALDSTVPIAELQPLEDAMAQSIAQRRVRAFPAVGFGLLALGVAFVGLLATLSTLVSERRRDLAIRSALGASSGQLTRGIMGHGVALTVAGLVLGLGLGTAAARGLSALLYRVSPFDVTTFAGVALVIGIGALLTAYLAAWRVRGIDPLLVLRDE
jgi:putative ABC transport system permease protein